MTDETPIVLNDLDLARQTLRAICLDAEAPAAARGQASRTLLELSGHLKAGGYDSDNKDLSTMSVSELDKMIARLEAKASEG